MGQGNRVELVFAGDDKSLQRTFDSVGSGAREMADDVGKASKRMASDAGGSSRDIAGAVDASEGKFRGLGDTIGGTGDVMEGFRTGNVATMAMGFADLAGGMTEFVIPALTAMKTALVSGLAPALTLISAHPLIAGLLAAGVIIGGLILLEKKFGIVSDAVRFLKEKALDPLMGVFAGLGAAIGGAFTVGVDLAKKAINTLIGLVETGLNFIFLPYRTAAGFIDKIPVIGGAVPDFVKRELKLPRLHTGGVFPGFGGMEGLAILQAGERVSPRGTEASQGIVVNVAGSVITERDLGRVIADALRQNALLGVT